MPQPPFWIYQTIAPDQAVTEKCKEAGRFLDLPVMDHIIVTKDSYFSFADEGLI